MVAPRSEEGVFLVDDAIYAAREAHLITKEEQQFAIQPRTLDEILFIASVIAQRQLPADVVNNILQFAGVHLIFQIETSEFCRGYSEMNEVYLQLHLPSLKDLKVPLGVDVSKCSLLVADCVSKDQGWASDQREYNGTYCESSSWCEVVVTSPSVECERKERERARALFCPNLRAGRNFRHHRKYFDSSSNLLQRIKLGDLVSIVLRSRYPGWTNSAKYGRLAACFMVELTDDFSFNNILSSSNSIGTAKSETPSISCCLQ